MIPRTQKKKTGGTATPRYRMLREGETIKKGDEFQDPWGRWCLVRWSIGEDFDPTGHWPTRRIKSAKRTAKPPKSSRPNSKKGRAK